jgi:hypothetical protein
MNVVKLAEDFEDYLWSYLYCRIKKSPTGFHSIETMEKDMLTKEQYFKSLNIAPSKLWRNMLKTKKFSTVKALSMLWLIKGKKCKLGAYSVMSKKEYEDYKLKKELETGLPYKNRLFAKFFIAFND